MKKLNRIIPLVAASALMLTACSSTTTSEEKKTETKPAATASAPATQTPEGAKDIVDGEEVDLATNTRAQDPDKFPAAPTPPRYVDEHPAPKEVPPHGEELVMLAKKMQEKNPESKEGLYNILKQSGVADYTDEDILWAVNNLGVDWNEVACDAAIAYQKLMPHSQRELFEILYSQPASFTVDEARYAVKNAKIDWNQVALEWAKHIKEGKPEMSDEELYNFLVQVGGPEYSPEQAKWAVEHLNQ
ncbi:hypothetical protein BSR29_01270 [Boudabousia liubingyangii]|uniref:Putative host cell surface-exposed lipoprotein Ltp-like HTH region domain-containing protein n=1 Tax=Boudabousia liubingyangii TaxID=1921764 RepID=A0A1Q5PPU0_9ACTO|nr:Ltp family lipoprotein [Boudabousia liubingyangii]OKL49618.1 hypothetical protein BSR29_01270 [Boudabousia liubingyangii]